jgi:type I restriction enzyme S subunit
MDYDYIPFPDLLCDIVDNRGKTCPTSKSGMPLIATNCIRNDLLYPAYEKIRYVSKETYETWFRGHPKPGDLIFVTKGTPGRVCIAPDPVDFCIAQDMVAVRANEAKVYPKYLFAILRSQSIQKQIEQMHVGSLIPHFKKGDFDKLLLPIPDRKTQESIGDVYFNLSCKIELNRCMNEILESIARAVFKSWFVDFDPVHAKADGRIPAGMDARTAALFPDRFEGSETGTLLKPKGWKDARLGDVIKLIKGRSYSSDELVNSNTALVTLKSFQRGGGYRVDGLKSFAGTYKKEQIVNPGELIVACTDVTQAAEVIGKPAIVRGDSKFKALVASLDVAIIRPLSEDISVPFLYCLFRTEDFQSHIYGYTTGTTVLHLLKDGIYNYSFISPASALIHAFSKLAEPLFDKIEMNEQEATTLVSVRNVLLQKLISGEVRSL